MGHEYDRPQSTLMSSGLVFSITPRTESLVNRNFLHEWQCEGCDVQQILDFAIQHLDNTEFSPINLIILDNCTNQDNTCLLLSKDPYDYVQVRSVFESAVVVLRSIEIGCAGANTQFDTKYSGSDGVMRVSVRDRAEAS